MIKADKGNIKCKGNIVVQITELASIIMYLKTRVNELDPARGLKHVINKVLLKAFTANNNEDFLKTDVINYNELEEQIEKFKELENKLYS